MTDSRQTDVPPGGSHHAGAVAAPPAAAALPTLMSYVGADYRYQFVNRAYERWFGTPPKSLVGRHLRDALGEQAWDEIAPYARRALAGETVCFDSLVPYRRSGPHWVRATYTPDTDETGLVRGFGAIIVDIGQQKQAEEAAQTALRELRESEHRLRLTMEASQTGVWDWDITTGEVRWSPECYAIHGLTPGSFRGTAEAFGRLIHPEDAQRVWTAVRAAAKASSLYECEFRIVRPDGSVRWVINRGRMLANPVGGRSRMVGTINDITARRETQLALQESEARFRAIAQTTPDVLFTATPDGAVDYVNDQHREFTGLAPSTALGAGWADAVHPEDRDAAVRRWLEAVRSGEPYESEFRMGTPERGYRWFAARARAIREPDGSVRPGRITKWVGCCTDIHGARTAQELLAGINDRLRAAVDAKTAELERSHQALRLSERMATLGAFAAGIGHDLANLLLPMRSRLDELLTDSSVPPRARLEVEALQSATRHLQGLCRGLRLFALDPDADVERRTDPGAWAAEIAPVLRTAVPRNIGLVWALPADLPAVAVAPHRLSQAVLNLVQNARDAIVSSPAVSAGMVEIGAEAVREGRLPGRDLVRIWVRDNGPGMPDDVIARCREPFFTTKAESAGGTGLGLSIVEGIASKAGGRTEIDSAPGRGTTVSMFLPVAAADRASPARPEALITLGDPRASALASSLLCARGFAVRTGGPPDADAHMNLWITDATPEALRAAGADGPARGARIIAVGVGADELWRPLAAATLPAGAPLWRLSQAIDEALDAAASPAP